MMIPLFLCAAISATAAIPISLNLKLAQKYIYVPTNDIKGSHLTDIVKRRVLSPSGIDKLVRLRMGIYDDISFSTITHSLNWLSSEKAVKGMQLMDNSKMCFAPNLKTKFLVTMHYPKGRYLKDGHKSDLWSPYPPVTLHTTYQ